MILFTRKYVDDFILTVSITFMLKYFRFNKNVSCDVDM